MLTLRPIRTSLRTSLAILCGLGAAAAAHAADDDAIATDRPDFVESSQVVGKGRAQLETSVQWEREDGQRTLSTPTLVRLGVGESFELRFETDGRTVTHAGADNSTGWADTAAGIKWHVADQAGNAPSMALLLHADLPSGSAALRGHGVRPSLRLVAEWEFAQGLSLGVMPGIGSETNENGSRYGYGILAATLGKEFNERVRGFVELAAPQVAHAADGGTQLSFDTGLTYLVNKDCQLDAVLTHGLNRRSPDLGVGIGLSIRL
jgi:hypothetical protein